MSTAAEMVSSLERRIAESIDSSASTTLSDGRNIRERGLAELRAELEYWRHQLELEQRGRGGIRMVCLVFKSDG